MSQKYHFTEEDVVKLVLAYHEAHTRSKELYPEQDTNPTEASLAFDMREEVITRFASELGCSVAAVRGKLVVEKRYIARQYIHKRTYKANKERVVERLETALGLEQGSLDSLEKINRKCMENLVQGLKLAQNGVVNFDFGMFFEYVDCPASYVEVPSEFKLY
jgi:hypothetical protein